MDAIGAQSFHRPFPLEHAAYRRPDRRQPQLDMRVLRHPDDLDIVAAPCESTKLTPAKCSTTPLTPGSSMATRTRSTSASAVAKKTPPSIRSTTVPGMVSSPGCESRSRNTWVPRSRPSVDTSGCVVTYTSHSSDSAMPMTTPARNSEDEGPEDRRRRHPEVGPSTPCAGVTVQDIHHPHDDGLDDQGGEDRLGSEEKSEGGEEEREEGGDSRTSGMPDRSARWNGR